VLLELRENEYFQGYSTVMNRRNFITQTALSALALSLTPGLISAREHDAVNPGRDTASWKGFNLLSFFNGRPSPFPEQDFEIMASWGFTFARIPISYWCWSKKENWMEIDEKVVRWLDEAVAYGKKYNIHISINLHRIPGYCINEPEKEPYLLFGKEEKGRALALTAAVHHWKFLAQRYKGIPSAQLSFDLINEPPTISEEIYLPVARALVDAIRKEDPDRLIITDGLNVGTQPINGMVSWNMPQSTRGYAPSQLTHYLAPWVYKPEYNWGVPTWPLTVREGDVWDKARLDKHYAPWRDIEQQGVKVHVGEWGVYNKTPHGPTLKFMKDILDLWNGYGWGWALWNLRGDFGVLNSQRADVKYESFKGHQLDRKMLELLLAVK
jgi:endoglucanase